MHRSTAVLGPTPPQFIVVNVVAAVAAEKVLTDCDRQPWHAVPIQRPAAQPDERAIESPSPAPDRATLRWPRGTPEPLAAGLVFQIAAPLPG